MDGRLKPVWLSSTLHHLAQRGGELVGADCGVVPKANEFSIAAHQIDHARVVHRIIAAGKRLLLEINAIEGCDFLDCREVSGEPDESRPERGEIGLELGGRV